jgi:hypothetical protein
VPFTLFGGELVTLARQAVGAEEVEGEQRVGVKEFGVAGFAHPALDLDDEPEAEAEAGVAGNFEPAAGS